MAAAPCEEEDEEGGGVEDERAAPGGCNEALPPAWVEPLAAAGGRAINEGREGEAEAEEAEREGEAEGVDWEGGPGAGGREEEWGRPAVAAETEPRMGMEVPATDGRLVGPLVSA